MPENSGSIRVLEKVGMRFDRLINYEGEQVQRWLLDARREPPG